MITSLGWLGSLEFPLGSDQGRSQAYGNLSPLRGVKAGDAVRAERNALVWIGQRDSEPT